MRHWILQIVFKILAVAFLLAAGLPGLIWYQHRRIMKLEKLMAEVFDIVKKVK